MNTTYRAIERNWRVRRAQYLIETGRTSTEPRQHTGIGADQIESDRRTRRIIRRLEVKIFGLQFDADTQTSAWDCALETEIRKQIGRDAMRKRWGRV